MRKLLWYVANDFISIISEIIIILRPVYMYSLSLKLWHETILGEGLVQGRHHGDLRIRGFIHASVVLCENCCV